MKRSYNLLLIFVMVLILSMSMSVSAFAEEGDIELTIEKRDPKLMFSPTEATLTAAGKLVLTYDSASYDKMYAGSAMEAVVTADPEKLAEKQEGKYYTLPVSTTEGTFFVASHSIKNSGWYTRVFEIDLEARKLYLDSSSDPMVSDNYTEELKEDKSVLITDINGKIFETFGVNKSKATVEKDGTITVQLIAGGKRAECTKIALVEQTEEDEVKEAVEIKGVRVPDDTFKLYLFEFTIDAEDIGKKIPLSTYRLSYTSSGTTYPDGWNQWGDQKYITVQNTADIVNQMIARIKIQNNNEFTPKYIKLSKQFWDALDDTDKEKDDGYFSENTGDASLDDPLNIAPDKEKELLVVSFGTSYNGSRVATIGAIEKALANAYPDYAVRRAFTAQIIINHIFARDGERIDNVKEAVTKAVRNNVKELVVQPTHLMSGLEYEELKNEIDKYADKMDIKYAKPLLDSDEDKEIVAKAVVEQTVAQAGYTNAAAASAADVALVFMGHGTSHAANATYTHMQQAMNKLGYRNCFVGTVEGKPASTALDKVKKAVEDAGYKKIILRPLMVVAGDHANNDMAGDWAEMLIDGGEQEIEGSGKVNLGPGFGEGNVTSQIYGLGEIEAVRDLYVAHSRAVIDVDIDAYQVIEEIKALPDADKITTSDADKNAIKAARAHYDALSDEEKKQVDEGPILLAESTIARLEALEAVTKAQSDTKAAEDKLKQAEKNLEEAQKKVDTSKDDIIKAQQDVIKAKDDVIKAKEEMLKSNADLLKAKADLEQANADLAKVNAELAKAKQDAEAANGNTSAKDAEISALQEKLAIQKVVVKNVKAKGQKRKATITWKSAGSGYKYEVYTSKKVSGGFKKAKTVSGKKAVLKSLKSKKTYYVKVRAFKTVGDEKVYTQFSETVSVKIK